MRRHSRCAALCALLLGTLLSVAARAQVASPTPGSGQTSSVLTVTGISGASRFTGLDGSGAALKVFGGAAGLCNGDGNTTCDSCASVSGFGDAALQACNRKRIYPTLRLVISFTSASATGYPVVTVRTSSTTNTALNLQFGSSQFVSAGQSGAVAVLWGDLCGALSADSASPDSGDCQTADLSSKIRIGLSQLNDQSLDESGDSSIELPIQIDQAFGVVGGVSHAEACTSANPGLCHMQFIPGDAKASVRNIRTTGTFPTFSSGSSPGRFLKVRVFALETNDPVFNPARFNQFSANAEAAQLLVADLNIRETSEQGTVDISPTKIEGLQNGDETTPYSYYFKYALVDESENVGLYASLARNADCGFSQGPQAQDASCHFAQPGEVVGVLSEQVNCVIATAAWGSRWAPPVGDLRDFRDQVLKRSSFGRAFVEWYYSWSPPVARWVAEHKLARPVVRALLWPAWATAWAWHSTGPAAGLAVGLLAGLFGLALIASGALLARTVLRWALRTFGANLLLALVILVLSFAHPAAFAQDVIEEALTEELAVEPDEAPPKPEYPYPGADSDGSSAAGAADGATQGSSATNGSSSTGGKNSQRPRSSGSGPVAQGSTPVQNGWVNERPVRVDPDSDSYFYTKEPDDSARRLEGPPEPIEFRGWAGAEKPTSIRSDGSFQYSVESTDVRGSYGVRGAYFAYPLIENADNGATFQDIYGSFNDEGEATSGGMIGVLVDYERILGFGALGRISARFTSGAIFSSGRGRFRSAARVAEEPEEVFTFINLPNTLGLTYLLQFLGPEQLLVPYIEGGAGYFTFVELRDDNKSPSFGGSPVAYFAGGLRVLLDGLDRPAIRRLDEAYGINHVWLFAEFRQQIGLNKKFDFTSQVGNAGVSFDF
jgi:hypothetical protein